MQNMNNELEGLQAALKAYEQLAPHADSIQQIQKICNDLNAQVPSLEQAYKLYQQAYPAILELRRIYPKLYAQAAAQSPATPPLPVEELNGVIADMPEPEAWYKSIGKKKLQANWDFLKEISATLLGASSDDDIKMVAGSLLALAAIITLILRLSYKDSET